MTDAPTVVIGGGVIGLSVAYHLGQAGVGEILLLERNRLGSGTSWHAAGIVGPLRSSRNLTELARYGIDLFRHLEDETGQATGYRQTGGYWLAQTADRMEELKRLAAMGRMHGLSSRIVTPPEVRERSPFLVTDDLQGGLWVTQDGQINPVDLCMTYAHGARLHGVDIREQSGVIRMQRRGDRVVSIALDNGQEMAVRTVINCAGLWARELAAMVEVPLPLKAVEHMYIVTEPVSIRPNPCPVIRDLDSGIYLKGEAGKLVLGMFESNARLWDPSSIDPKVDFLEFPEDWDHAEPMLTAGIRRVPALASLGIARFVNGPESFTPDTRQIMGRVPGLANYFVAAGFNSIGIMSSAGVGRAMTEWVLQGRPRRELWSVDFRRFLPGDGTSAFLDARIPEAVHGQFDIHWPFRQYRTGRDRLKSPWHQQLATQGAVFGAPTGWERPLWFAKEANERVLRYSYVDQDWWPAAEREAHQLMTSGTVFELSPFSKFLVDGPGATQCLQSLCTNCINVAPGRIVYSLWLNEDGGIEGECTLTRLEVDRWLAITGAATRVKDYWHLRERLPGSVKVKDVTEDFAMLGIMGPSSEALFRTLSLADTPVEGFPLATSRRVTMGQIEVWANRMGYVGEKGWELMIPVDQALQIMEAVIEEMTPLHMGFAGHFCLDSCRLEKDRVHWGHDVGPDDNPMSAGLMAAVRLSGGFDFIGKAALTARLGVPPTVRRRLFEVLASKPPLMLHDEPIWYEGERVGHTTSGGCGFRTGKVLCMGYVREPHGSQGSDAWSVEVAGQQYPLRMLDRPPYDPDGKRMRT